MMRWMTLATCLGLAACNGSTDRDRSANDNALAANNAMSVANEAVAANAAEPKSIIRPEIVEEQAPEPAIRPIATTISFATSGAKLDDAGRAAIDALLAEPAMQAGGPIILRGHSDSQGSDADNIAASMRRAEAVRDYLVEKGVAKDRIATIALGERRPVAPNAKLDGSDDPEGRAKNRRVDMEVPAPSPVDPATATDAPPKPAAGPAGKDAAD